MNRFADVIACWPNPAEFAADLGVKLSTVNVWKHRDSIPSGYWEAIVAAAQGRGFLCVTYAALARIAAARRVRAGVAA